MSFAGILDRLEREGKLVRYLPSSGREGRRSLYLAAGFCREMLDGKSAIGFFGQKRPMITLFDKWVAGRPVAVRVSGRGPGAILARLEPPPHDVWEIRVTEPSPQLRVFVRFAGPDVLVAFLARNRDALGSAGPGNGKRSKAWLEAMYDCESEWNRIFGGADPFRGATLRDYVTENAEECP